MTPANTTASARARRLRALGITPLRVRGRQPAAAPAESVPVAESLHEPFAPPAGIRRLALQPDLAELQDPALNALYTALTAAIGKAGLQAIRVCDVAADPGAAVIVLGSAPVPEGVPAARLLRAEALAGLQADRDRKRRLWETMQALGRHGTD